MSTVSFRSLQQRLDQIHDVLYEAPGNLYIKNLRGSYIYVNQNQLRDIGYGSLAAVEGMTDFDSPWQEYAPLLIKNDETAFIQKQCTGYEALRDCGGRFYVVRSQKKRFYVDDCLVGVWGNSLEVPLDELKNANHFSTATQFIDIKRRNQLILTPRQKEVLYAVLQGCKPKMIGAKLGVSRRTVEHHIQALKDENGYHSIQDILLNVRAI
jgi:DNA-binding CsgD family transcriptional regulator